MEGQTKPSPHKHFSQQLESPPVSLGATSKPILVDETDLAWGVSMKQAGLSLVLLFCLSFMGCGGGMPIVQPPLPSQTIGTFSGTFSMNGSTINTSLTIKQQGPPLSDGSIPINVSATFSNAAACGGFTSAGSEGGSMSGLSLSTQMHPNAGATNINFSGRFTDNTEKTINGSFVVFGGPCDQQRGGAMLTSP